MSLIQNLRDMERAREAYWTRYPATSPLKLRWRALTVRHSFHVLPGESILELGAGSGLWTEHLSSVLRDENPITAAVFNEDLSKQAARNLPNVQVVEVKSLEEDLQAESFDYVVGTAILCHDRYAENLQALYQLLRPGGQLLFFEANFWNPQVFLKNTIKPIGRWAGNAECEIGMRKYRLMHQTSLQGFTEVDVIPYDIVHPRTPAAAIYALQSISFLLEHLPVVQDLCGTLYIWAKKPGRPRQREQMSLARDEKLFGSTSVVVPCRNEAMNIPGLVENLVAAYGQYLKEIIIVDDNSTDATADVTLQIAKTEPRVRLVERRPPPGVGRALRDGYRAATGRYILSMDCDFLLIVPEIRDLFEVISQGHEGAIGSRFSHDSILVNYPVAKIIANRGFHLLVRILLGVRVRDISNNLKLYRADILKTLDIKQGDFAANAETGLKPILDGHDIKEVPVSWINRSSGMGSSSFKLSEVVVSYLLVIIRLLPVRIGRIFRRAPVLRADPPD